MSWTLEQPQPRKNPMLGKERKDPSIGVHIARAMLGWEKKKSWHIEACSISSMPG
jgi:hypothetical protein